MDFLLGQGVDISLIQMDGARPTGVVNVEIGSEGNAKYDIVFPSAWDFIEKPKDEHLDEDFILVFGSLASRNSPSRNTLLYLLEKAHLSLFDVNFRAPHYSRALIELLLHSTDIVKINEDELEIIAGWIDRKNSTIEDICKEIAQEFSIDHIIVTLGGDGALTYKSGKVFLHHGCKVNVVDTVGSGDSFLAAYLSNYLKTNKISSSLELACATGAFVATQNGANPQYAPSDISEFIHRNNPKSHD
jgi:fructokinase